MAARRSSCGRCASGSKSTARSSRAARATRSWTRSASRSRTSTRSACGGAGQRLSGRRRRRAYRRHAARRPGGASRTALLKYSDAYVTNLTAKLLAYGVGRVTSTARHAVRPADRQRRRAGSPVRVDRVRHRDQRAVPAGARGRGDDRGSGCRARSVGDHHMFITKKHMSRRTVLRGTWRHRRAAVPRFDGGGADAAAQDGGGAEAALRGDRDGARRGGQHAGRRQAQLLVAGEGGTRLRVHARA